MQIFYVYVITLWLKATEAKVKFMEKKGIYVYLIEKFSRDSSGFRNEIQGYKLSNQVSSF